MKSYVIHLIRNMPCEGNLEGRYIGRTESPLALESIAQLAQRKRQYQYPAAAAFYASPSTRCVDTLKILYPQADPEVVLELAECDFGEWEGKTAQRAAKRPPLRRLDGPGAAPRPPPGGGERRGVRPAGVPGLRAAGEEPHGPGPDQRCAGDHRRGDGLPAGGLRPGLRPRPTSGCAQPGCGYSVRITPGLWMRSGVMEVFAQLPGGGGPGESDHLVVDLAREAAQRAYGSGDGGLPPETEA